MPHKKITHRQSGMSPQEAAEIFPELDLANYESSESWEDDDATDDQLGALEKFGFRAGLDLTKGEASFLLDILVNRAEDRLCTVKQARALRRLGFDDVENFTFTEAAAELGTRWARNSDSRSDR
jgi:hypothetical protein